MPDDLRKLAVAVECFHKASLIHDDIEDADSSRYDRQTLHIAHGVPVALNVGDLLLGEGYRLIAECRCASGRKVEMFRAAAQGHRTLCLGQGAELCWSREPSPLSSAEVLDIFRRKTAPAFEVALHLGATLAGAGENVHEVLSRYSEALGIAYQIRDDLDDFHDGQTGQADRKGDAHVDRPNIVLAVATETAEGDDRRRLEDVWRRRSTFQQHWAELAGFFERTGVVARTSELMESYKQLAAGCLGRLDNPSLKGLLRRVITRIFNDTQTLFCCDDKREEGHRS
jgi:geranylgeranyl pyrophosphate synthase